MSLLILDGPISISQVTYTVLGNFSLETGETYVLVYLGSHSKNGRLSSSSVKKKEYSNTKQVEGQKIQGTEKKMLV